MGTTETSDEAIEAFFAGNGRAPDGALGRFADEALMAASGPAPRPGPALVGFLRQPTGFLPAPLPRPLGPAPAAARSALATPVGPRSGEGADPLLRRLRRTVRIAAGAVAAAAAVTAGATTGVLPEPAVQAVSWVVKTVTPFEVDRPTRTPEAPAVPPGATTSTAPAGPGATAPAVPAATTVGTVPRGSPAAPPGQPAVTAPGGRPPSLPPGGPGPVEPPWAGDGPAQPPGATMIPPFAPGPPGGVVPPPPAGHGALPATGADRAGQPPNGELGPPASKGPARP